MSRNSRRIHHMDKPSASRCRVILHNGQSTLEYILVLSAILVALIAFVSTTIKPATEQVMSDSQGTIKAAVEKLKGGLNLL